MLPGSGSFQEIEQLPRSGQIAGSHLPPCHPDTSLWHVGLQGQPLLEQFRRLVVDGEMLELGCQTDTQTGMVGESLQRVPAELPGLLEITETQELPVGLERGFGRSRTAVFLQAAGDLELLRLLIRVGVGREMPPTERARIDDPLPPQGNDRNEDDNKPEPGVVRLQVCHTVARVTWSRSRGPVLLAVIMRPDPVYSRWHRGNSLENLGEGGALLCLTRGASSSRQPAATLCPLLQSEKSRGIPPALIGKRSGPDRQAWPVDVPEVFIV